jgi:hypothetical protein
LGSGILIEIFSISLNMFKLLSNLLFDSFKLMSFADNSEKYSFKNARLHLTIFKNVRRSYIFILKLFYK